MPTWLAILATTGYIYNIYVDSVGGNDSNDGATPATAIQSLAHLSAFTIQPFTEIHLAKGSSWTGATATINLDVSDVKISSYGSGALPIIDGRMVMTAGGWTKTGGRTSVYQWDYTALNNGAEQHNIWENGVRLTRIPFTTDLATTLGLVDATAGSYYVPAESAFVTGSPVTFYVHATAGGNPASSGIVYKTQGVQWAIQLGSTTSLNGKVYDVEVMGGSHHNGNIVLGRSSYAQNVISRWGTIHSVYTDSGFFINCTSYDCEQGFDFVANKGSASDGFIEMNGCVCDVSATTGNIQGPGFFVHGTTMATIRYINCISRKHLGGFGINGIGQNGQVIYISGCTATCPTDATQFKAYDINTRDNGGTFTSTVTIDRCLSDGYGFFFWGFLLNDFTTVNINGGRGVIRGNNPAIQFRYGQAIDIGYCSFYGPDGAYSALELTVNGGPVNFHHNICDNFTSAGTEQFGSTTYTATNNIWHGSTFFRVAGTAYASFAAYDAAFEAACSSADPLWVQTPSIADNFAVQAGSPADTLLAGYTHAP